MPKHQIHWKWQPPISYVNLLPTFIYRKQTLGHKKSPPKIFVSIIRRSSALFPMSLALQRWGFFVKVQKKINNISHTANIYFIYYFNLSK